MLLQDRERALVVLGDDALHFLVDPDRGLLAVVRVLRDLAAEEDLLFLLAEGQRPDRVAHAPLADHLARQLGGALDVVAGAGGHAARSMISSAMRPPSRMAMLLVQVVARVVVLLVDRQLLRHAERHAARDDRDLVDRIGVRQQHGDQRVAGLVDRGDPLLLVADDHRAALGAHQHLVLGELEVVHADDLLVVARGVERRLVDQVGQVGAARSPACPREHGDVDVVGRAGSSWCGPRGCPRGPSRRDG